MSTLVASDPVIPDLCTYAVDAEDPAGKKQVYQVHRKLRSVDRCLFVFFPAGMLSAHSS